MSKDRINNTIKKHHDESLYEHSDVSKTLQFLQRSCAFFNMRQHVKTYIKKCLNCQKNKHFTHARYNEMQYRKSSKKSWKEVIMNFITKLFKSKDSTTQKIYDFIMIMINRLTKNVHMIAFKKSYLTKQLKYIVLNRLIQYHEMSEAYINDRDKFITLNYWQIFIFLLETKLKLSTTYHFQTDK